MENIDKFMEIYEKNLRRAIREYPEDYYYGEETVPEVSQKMKSAFCRRSYNKDSHAIKWTCKELGIKHTYSDINGFVGSCEMEE